MTSLFVVSSDTSPLTKKEAELLFSHFSLRAGIKSTIIHLAYLFDRWDEIFGYTIFILAMVDRLIHKVHL